MSFDTLVDELARARADVHLLDAAPWHDTIANVQDGYAVQAMFARQTGGDVRGWKVTALVPDQQRLYLNDGPVAGALLGPFVHAAPAKLSLKSFLNPLLECELSFKLAADLPPRAEPYTRDEIEVAIEAVIPAMEIADCRWTDDASGLLKLADSMGNGVFISGEPVKDWQKLDLSAIDVTLTRDGRVGERGSSSRILGNPLLAVIALANCQFAQPLPAGGLRRGQIVTTGSCTTPIPPKAGCYIGEFGKLGTLRLDLTA